MLPPQLISLNDFGGDSEKYLDHLYGIFCQEIAHANLTFLGLPISCQFRPETNGKHFGFWHLVSQGQEENERLIDLRRCEHLAWISYVLKNALDKNLIHCWENRRYGNTHIVLLLKQSPYAVVLAKRTKYYLLKTAYPIDQPHQLRKMLAERAKSIDPR